MTSDIARMIRLARDQARLTTLDYATQLFDDFIELHGDRNFRDDGAVVGGIGFLAGQPVTVIGIQKGKNLQDNLKRNFEKDADSLLAAVDQYGIDTHAAANVTASFAAVRDALRTEQWQ